ncbi:hypothetical protein QBC35DRAFT_448352 [Podospora australis]|uniref:Uncharacterized protein n=1 Tax=Podospora australis TaxID=1536484 RepID=A0AAN6X051_9PEZI|nr:hypothetical protein QBC35DRAFT_448352 [Podospora australis]
MADQGSSGGQRPRSPSDALMIRRGSEAATAGSRSNSPIDLAADPSDYGSPPAGHRRVISAPASQQVPSASPDHSDHDGSSHGSSRADADADDTMTEVGEYELATSLVDLVMGRTHHAMQAYDSLEELASHINYRGERQCGFMEGCDYMAEARQRGISIPMRKVISHLFGRNKTCTRSVPDQVWYCVCRKHYQRGRYRNQQDFMINLCTYVITQTLRIVAWSNDNVRNGTPEDGGLMNWTLTPRRREQARREAKDGKDKASGKRKYEDDEDAAEDDDDDDAAEIQYPSASNGVPVPDWLYDMCYKEYLTREVIEIVYRIRGEIEAGNLIGFPDVEFLPNISGANAKPKPKAKSKAKEAKGRTKKPAAASNRVGPTRISARSAINHDEDDEDYKPRSKRQRYEAEMEAQAVAPPRNSGRTVPYFGNGGTVPAASPLQQVPSRGGYHQRSVSDVSGVNTTNWSARPSAPVPAQYGYQQHPGGAVAYDHYIQGGHPSSSNSYSNMGGPAGAPSVFRGARVPDGPEFVVGGAAEMDRAFHQRREFMLQQQQREFAQGQGYRPQEAFGGGGAGSYHYGGTGYGGAALGSGAKHSRNQSTPSVLGGGAGYGPIPGQYPAPSQPDLRRASYQIPPPPPRR